MNDLNAEEKRKELEKIKREFKRKVSEKKLNEIRMRVLSAMICVLARRLIRNTGYSTAATILRREFRKLGREHAITFSRIFNLKRGCIKDASKALKIAALFLGLHLSTKGSETIVTNCPQGEEALKWEEPILCTVCIEYNNGILSEMLGESYRIKRTKWIFQNDKYCEFRVVKV